MIIPDELLAAYVDGELEGSERARIELAMQRDAALAQRIARQRAQREHYRGAVQALHSERRAQRARTLAGPAQVIDLARARAERRQRNDRHRKSSRRVALAAGLAGGLLGVVAGRLLPDGALTQYYHGALVAHGTLADALSEQLTASPIIGSAVSVGLTFRAKGGQYCRTFSVRDAHPLAGLACHEQGQWRVLALDSSETRAAGGRSAREVALLPPALAQAVDQRISGAPLDVQAELSARRGGWR